MRPAGASTRSIFASVMRLVGEELGRRCPELANGNPRLGVFPKRVHELGVFERPAPDGLSSAYVALAAGLNRRRSDPLDDDPIQTLLRMLEEEVAEALVHEQQLVEYLNKINENSNS